MSPAMTNQIHYEPLLPVERMLLHQRVPNGAIIRGVAIYDEPFRRKDGLSGHAVALNTPVSYAIDMTPDSGRPGILSSYIAGRYAREYGRRSAEERKQTFLEAVTQRFGPKAVSPVQYIEADWAKEAFTMGGMIGDFPPGVLTEFGPALREPCGRIHWAGTETATQWHAQIEGAVRSDERVAEEVRAAEPVAAG
jgi:monoamine oxidase